MIEFSLKAAVKMLGRNLTHFVFTLLPFESKTGKYWLFLGSNMFETILHFHLIRDAFHSHLVHTELCLVILLTA